MAPLRFLLLAVKASAVVFRDIIICRKHLFKQIMSQSHIRGRLCSRCFSVLMVAPQNVRRRCRNTTFWSVITCYHARLKWSNHLTPQQFGLAVDELWLPCWAVALAGVVENLDEGALLPRWTSAPLVKGVFKHQVKFWTVLGEKTQIQALKFTPKHLWSAQTVSKGNKEAHYFVGIDAVDLPQLIKSPLWPFGEGRRSLELLHLSEGDVGGLLIRYCGNKSTISAHDFICNANTY